MRSLSTRHMSVPKSWVQVCAQAAGNVWVEIVYKMGLFPQPVLTHKSLRINEQFIPQMYTYSIQLFTRTVGKTTSVISDLSAVYTPLTTITTTNIINKGLGGHPA